MTTETKGYTVAGLAARLQKAERAWIAYTAAQILAMTRGTKKTVLATKVFGQEKPSSTYRNCWSLAEKVFASTFHDVHRKAVVELGLDEALAYVQRVMEAHMTALKVSNQKDYTALAHFVGVEDIPAPEPEEVETETEATDEPEGQTDEPEARDPETVDTVGNIKLAISSLPLEQVEELAGWMAELIQTARAAEQPQRKAA